MIKLITPPGLLVTTALLAVYGAYAAWAAFVERSWLYAGLAAMAIAGCIGAALMKPWSRYPVYVLTAAFSAAWVLSIYGGMRAGYFEFAYTSNLAIARALAPGLLLVILAASCSYLVFRQFRGAPSRDDAIPDRPVT
jgi:hypothetical protein